MGEVAISEAVTAEEVEHVRNLMREYGRYLAGNPAGAARICVPGFEDEMRALPGVYVAPGGVLLLAYVRSIPLGCCAVKPARVKFAVEGERSCEMKRLWVDGQARGLGVGKALVRAATEWAVKAGYTTLYLDTAPAAMPEASGLYRSMGFDEIDRFNDNPVEGLAFFRKQLTGGMER